MNHGKTVLAQILDAIHPEQFRRCAQRHPMRRETPALSAYDHFATMVFAQPPIERVCATSKPV